MLLGFHLTIKDVMEISNAPSEVGCFFWITARNACLTQGMLKIGEFLCAIDASSMKILSILQKICFCIAVIQNIYGIYS